MTAETRQDAMTSAALPSFLIDEELDCALKTLREEIRRAHACWQAWWTMRGRRYRAKYSDVFARHREYFKVAIHSPFTASVLAVWRLHDDGSGALSLQTIQSRMGPRPDIPKATQHEYRERLRSIRATVSGFQTIRHKVLAHRDPSYTVERAFKEANLKYRDLGRVIDASRDLVNLLLRARCVGVLSFDNSVTADTVRVIRRLHW